VSYDGDVLRIRSLHERRAHSVEAYVHEKHKLALSAGEEVVLSGASNWLSSQSAAGHRRVHTVTIPTGEEARLSEVSFTCVVRDSKILGCVAQSTDQEHGAMFNNLVKMAACLHVVGAARGAYTGR